MTSFKATFYAANAPITTYKAGDFLLTHTSGSAAKVIRFGQWLRYHGKMRKYAHWNHAAYVIDDQGTIIEARPTGVRLGHVSEYDGCPTYIVHTKFNKQSVDQAVAAAKGYLNDGYGWLNVFSNVIELITGVKLQITFKKTIDCSALVSMSLWAGGVVFDVNPLQMMPADLAAAFEIE